MPISNFDIILRLLVAFVLAAAVGLEREYYRKPAGLRTLVMVGVGSALFAIVSYRIRDLFPSALVDPSRIAAQIVTGIGFIGAGTIIHARRTVVGLTTAAIIFAVAAIGMAAGYGLFLEATATTVLIIGALYVLSYFVLHIRKRSPVTSELDKLESREDEAGEKDTYIMH